MLNNPNHKLKEREDRYCDVCNPNGHLCPSTLANRSNYIQNEEVEEEEEEEEEKEEKEPEESHWDADLEEAQDYHARVSASMRKQRQPPKCPAGWPAEV